MIALIIQTGLVLFSGWVCIMVGLNVLIFLCDLFEALFD